MAMGLLYVIDHIVIKIYDYVTIDIGFNGYFVTGAPCLIEGHGYNFASSGPHEVRFGRAASI